MGRRFKSCRAGHVLPRRRAELAPLPRATLFGLTDKTSLRCRAERTGRGLLHAAFATITLALTLPSVASAHGDLHEQITAVTNEIAASPHDARLYVKRGELHRFHGDLQAALSDYDAAARIDPSFPDADLGRGRALLEANRAGRARTALVRFLRARPDHGEGRLALARCLGRLGRRTEAAVEYTHAISLLPRPNPDVYVERARALAAAGRTGEAIRGLDEGLKRLGPLVALCDVAIELEMGRKNWDGALARLERIAASSARRETWLARRGEVLAAAGRSVEARESFEAAQQSIEALSPRLRQTRAMSRLEEKVRNSLEVLKRRSGSKEMPDAKS